MKEAPQNTIGLTHIGSAFDEDETLRDQLKARDVAYTEVEIPHLVGMGGCASLVFYASPVDGVPVTTLVVPQRGDVDSFGEAYYFFRGVTREEALRDEQLWLDRYSACRELEDQLVRKSVKSAWHRQETEVIRGYVYETAPICQSAQLRTYRAVKIFVGTFNKIRAEYYRRVSAGEYSHSTHGFVAQTMEPPRSSIFELEIPDGIEEEVLKG